MTQAPDLGERGDINMCTGQITNVSVGIAPGWNCDPGAVFRLARARQLLEEKEAATKDAS